jgi:hypothetical protein
MGVDVLHKIFVLATDGAHKGQSVKTSLSLKAESINVRILKFSSLPGILTTNDHKATFDVLITTNCDRVVIL